jgi:ubiquinone/menaquinone biosynthesis C-methylase UbiE
MIYKVANQFKRPSGLLGRFISNLMSRGNRWAYEILINDMDLQPDCKLFEIGFGPGTGIRDLCRKFNTAKVYGLDFSDLMFQKASVINQENIKNRQVTLFHGDFLTYDIPESGFDRIFCLNVVYFWDDLLVPFSKIRSLLNDTGRFHFYMSSKHDLDRLKFTDDDVFNKHSIEIVETRLRESGFKEVSHYFRNGYFISAG